MRLDSRVKALEGVLGTPAEKPWHRILVRDSYAEALADYMASHPEKHVSGDDYVMWIKLVSPKFDENGKIIPSKERSSREGPTLAAILAQLRSLEHRP